MKHNQYTVLFQHIKKKEGVWCMIKGKGDWLDGGWDTGI